MSCLARGYQSAKVLHRQRICKFSECFFCQIIHLFDSVRTNSFSDYFVCVQTSSEQIFSSFDAKFLSFGARVPPLEGKSPMRQPLPSLQGEGLGVGSVSLRGLVCNFISHREEYSHTEEQSEQRNHFTQRRGGIWRFRRIFSESMRFSEFGESATVGRSPSPPFSSLRPGGPPLRSLRSSV